MNSSSSWYCNTKLVTFLFVRQTAIFSVVMKDGPWPSIQCSGSDGLHVLTELLLPFKSCMQSKEWERERGGSNILHQVRNESILSLILPKFNSAGVVSLSVLRNAAPNEYFKSSDRRLHRHASKLKIVSFHWLAFCPRVVHRDEKKRTFWYSCCPGLHEKDSL